LQTIFAIAQSDLILQLLAGLGVILLAMVLSTHGHRLRPFFDIKYALPDGMTAPEWALTELDWDEFFENWLAALTTTAR